MNIKETIRAEIERRMFEDYNGPDAEQNETAQGVCAGILAFLDTLPDNSLEGLEEEMEKFFETMPVLEHENIFEDTFKNIARHFSEWGASHAKTPTP